MNQSGANQTTQSAGERLRALLPPSADIPLYGLSLAGTSVLEQPAPWQRVLPDGVDQALIRFAGSFRDPEPRAVATQFSKYWFRAVIPPVLVCAAASRAGPEINLERLRLDTDGSGIPHLLVPDDPRIAVAPADGEALMEDMFAGHLDAFVALLVARSGLAPRVFWSNAANVIAWYLDGLKGQTATATGAARLAARWSDTPRHPRFAGHNPLHMPYEATDTADEQGARRRRICCARYLSADCELCETCPLSRASAARTANR